MKTKEEDCSIYTDATPVAIARNDLIFLIGNIERAREKVLITQELFNSDRIEMFEKPGSHLTDDICYDLDQVTDGLKKRLATFKKESRKKNGLKKKAT